ncbi:MAG: sulfite exporter TauE/SafE family protein [Pseudomonadota bacterium]|nr:sulfite exporter TauE/SafE family protein [Pseudomonadota bacterium]
MPDTSLLAAFLTGLLGGTHCVGMCGGIVAAMSFHSEGGKSGRQPFGFHLGYSAGRIASYVALGALAGLIGSAAFLSDSLFPLQRGLYVLAQVVLILLGLYLAGLNQSIRVLEKAGGVVWRRVQPLLAKVMPVRNLGQAVAAGALWGWLPCGLVYSVLVMALSTGGAIEGAALLLAFGLGTLPNLLLMGWAAESLRAFTRQVWVKRAAGAAVAAMGCWGLFQLVR